MQKSWISDIQNRNRGRFRNEFLVRFGEFYPSLPEISEELGCTVQNVDNALKCIMRYLKYVEINDLYDPIKYRQRYYGWKNENIGQNLMIMELEKLFNEKNIKFEIILLKNTTKVINLINGILIYSIFKEADFDKFLDIYNKLKHFSSIYSNILLIVHTIELKNKYEKIMQKDYPLEKIKIYLYDWAELGPVIRKLYNN